MLKILKLYNCKDKKCHLNIFKPELAFSVIPRGENSQRLYTPRKNRFHVFPPNFCTICTNYKLKWKMDFTYKREEYYFQGYLTGSTCVSHSAVFYAPIVYEGPSLKTSKFSIFQAVASLYQSKVFLLLALPTLAENIH